MKISYTELKKLYDKGIKIREISERADVDPATIYYQMKKHGDEPCRRFGEPTLDKFNDAQLGFLAGLMEGEGSIGFIRHGGNRFLIITTVLSNTSKALVDYVCELLSGKGYKIRINDTVTTKGGNKHYQVLLRGIKYSLPFLKELIPYLVSKKERAELVIQFSEMRMEHPCQPYTSQEIELAKRIRALNREQGKDTHSLKHITGEEH